MLRFLIILSLVFLGACEQKKTEKNNAAESDTLNVAICSDYPPFAFSKKGSLTGSDVLLINSLASLMNKKIVFHDVDFKGALKLVKDKKVDLAISAITQNKEREKNMDFSIPYHRSITVIVTPFATSIRNIDELEGKIIGVENGTVYEEYLKNDLLKKNKNMEILEKAKYSDLLSAMVEGKCHAIITGYSEAFEIQSINPNVKILPIEGTSANYCIAFPKGSTLVGEVNRNIEKIIQDGTLRNIEEQFFHQVIKE